MHPAEFFLWMLPHRGENTAFALEKVSGVRREALSRGDLHRKQPRGSLVSRTPGGVRALQLGQHRHSGEAGVTFYLMLWVMASAV